MTTGVYVVRKGSIRMIIEGGTVKLITDEDIVDGKIVIPAGVKKMDGGILISDFSKCKSVELINLNEVEEVGANTTRFGEGHFQNLKEVYAPELRIVRDHLFALSENLQKIIAPNVETVEEYGFAYSSKLIEVNFPKLTQVEASAFGGSHLERITLSPNIKYIGKGAFEKTDIEEFDGYDAQICDDAFYGGRLRRLTVNSLKNLSNCSLRAATEFESLEVFNSDSDDTVLETYPAVCKGYKYVVSYSGENEKRVISWIYNAHEVVQVIKVNEHYKIYSLKNGKYIVESFFISDGYAFINSPSEMNKFV